MKTRNKRKFGKLRLVAVQDRDMESVGFLLFETSKFIVLLNNVVKEADLGPLRSIRKKQIEPECDVLVLPRSSTTSMKFLAE